MVHWVNSEVKCQTEQTFGPWISPWNAEEYQALNQCPVTAAFPLRRCSRTPFNCQNFKTRQGWNIAGFRIEVGLCAGSLHTYMPQNQDMDLRFYLGFDMIRLSCCSAHSRWVLFQEPPRGFRWWSVHLTVWKSNKVAQEVYIYIALFYTWYQKEGWL